MTRAYTLKKRAERQAETRQRIVARRRGGHAIDRDGPSVKLGVVFRQRLAQRDEAAAAPADASADADAAKAADDAKGQAIQDYIAQQGLSATALSVQVEGDAEMPATVWGAHHGRLTEVRFLQGPQE